MLSNTIPQQAEDTKPAEPAINVWCFWVVEDSPGAISGAMVSSREAIGEEE